MTTMTALRGGRSVEPDQAAQTEVAQLISQLGPKRGRTLKDVAALTALSYTAIHEYFHGRKVPRVEALRKLAHAYALDTVAKDTRFDHLTAEQTRNYRQLSDETMERLLTDTNREVFLDRNHSEDAALPIEFHEAVARLRLLSPEQQRFVATMISNLPTSATG